MIHHRHGFHVEIQYQQAAVAVAHIAGTFRRDLGLSERRKHLGRRQWGRERRGRGGLLDVFELEKADGLRFAVFEDAEILLAQTLDSLAVLILDSYDFHHQLAVDREGRSGSGRLHLRLDLRERQQREEDKRRACFGLPKLVRPHQNVNLMVVVMVRIAFTASGNPNSGLVTVVFNCVTTT